MDIKTKTIIMEKARGYLNTGWHCSEGILKAVGGHYLGEINPQAFRISTAFEGGVGGTNEELCGALSGGLMVIGALYGRTNPRKSDYRCASMAAAYRLRFLEHFGYIRCARWTLPIAPHRCAQYRALSMTSSAGTLRLGPRARGIMQ